MPASTSPSQWQLLFKIALDIFAEANAAIGHLPEWSFGGGTALMLQIEHRESHDVDLFISDPQLLPYLNPETQEYNVSCKPDSYETDGARSLKLSFDGVGEIDFISCTSITSNPVCSRRIEGHDIKLETAAEIIAKKIYYRGARALRHVKGLDREFVQKVISQLMLYETNDGLKDEAQAITTDLLARAL